MELHFQSVWRSITDFVIIQNNVLSEKSGVGMFDDNIRDFTVMNDVSYFFSSWFISSLLSHILQLAIYS